ncbi:hypothetical protein ACVW00_000083 [Marmoricola sp. URHA0025 HA25]
MSGRRCCSVRASRVGVVVSSGEWLRHCMGPFNSFLEPVPSRGIAAGYSPGGRFLGPGAASCPHKVVRSSLVLTGARRFRSRAPGTRTGRPGIWGASSGGDRLSSASGPRGTQGFTTVGHGKQCHVCDRFRRARAVPNGPFRTSADRRKRSSRRRSWWRRRARSGGPGRIGRRFDSDRRLHKPVPLRDSPMARTVPVGNEEVVGSIPTGGSTSPFLCGIHRWRARCRSVMKRSSVRFRQAAPQARPSAGFTDGAHGAGR